MGYEKQFDYERAEPGMIAMSPAWIFRLIPIPKKRSTNIHTMFLTLREDPNQFSQDDWARRSIFVSEWNLLWESRWARSHILNFPSDLKWLKKMSRHRVQLVWTPRRSVSHHYLALYHLLPLSVRRRFALPHLRWGKWPLITPDSMNLDRKKVPVSRLRNAFAYYIWPFLFQDRKFKPRSSYSKRFPLVVLAESLDFWADHLHLVIEDTWAESDRVPFEDAAQKEDSKRYTDPRLQVVRPRLGGEIWLGEQAAVKITRKLVSAADTSHRLRQTVDLVLSNKVSDDFSDRWSREKEDFERAFFHKRSKTKVYFREVPDPVLSINPETVIEAEDIVNKLMMILSPKEKSVVLCLRTGILKQKEITEHLGYRNHSSVSRLIKQIAKKAKSLLDEC